MTGSTARPGRVRAVGLLSGGLDSTLAAKLLIEQGIEVHAINFTSPFCTCTPRNASCAAIVRAVKQLGNISCKRVTLGEEYIAMVRNPVHGYGRGMNPCIDCRIMKIRKAADYMREIGASFLFTGEVLGQRPMSQHRRAIDLIDRETGLRDVTLRPLSARHFEPTRPERDGLVDREKLLALSGRNRKPQIALADRYGIVDYPCPAGGCRLTDPVFAERLRDYFSHIDRPAMRDMRLFSVGRHFWTDAGGWIVVARDEKEGLVLASRAETDHLLEPLFSGPTVFFRPAEECSNALSLLMKYAKPKERQRMEVLYRDHGIIRNRIAVALPGTGTVDSRIDVTDVGGGMLMCYAIPGRVIETNGRFATIDYFGERQRVVTDLVTVTPGDYIFAQGGVAVSRIGPDEAAKSLAVWQDLFMLMKRVDADLSQRHTTAASPHIQALIARAVRGTITDLELAELLRADNPGDLTALSETANQIRWRHHGNASCVHGIIEFSNYCSCGCRYCGINRSSSVERYRMSTAQIVSAVQTAVDHYGFRAIVLQSGDDPAYDDAAIVSLVRRLRESGILVILSIGIRPLASYRRFFEAGARGVLLRFETANRRLFDDLRPGTSLDDRISLIRGVKKIGYVLATGFLIGLPGESDIDLIANVRLTRELDPDMYSFGPLISARHSALHDHRPVDFSRVLKTIALTRLVAPDANILVTSAMETLDHNAARKALLSGANSLMINLTPERYRPLYSIYDNRAGQEETIATQIEVATSLLTSLGRSPIDVSYCAVETDGQRNTEHNGQR